MQTFRSVAVARRALRSLHSRSSTNTINPEEINFFTQLSSQWWDERGEFAMLHRMNPARVGFIRDKIRETLLEEASARGESARPKDRQRKLLSGMNVLDVGCGGGLLSEVFHAQPFHAILLAQSIAYSH